MMVTPGRAPKGSRGGGFLLPVIAGAAVVALLVAFSPLTITWKGPEASPSSRELSRVHVTTKSALKQELFARAERAFERNKARRIEAFGPRLEGDYVSKGKVFTYYAPLYPCYSKERVGYWGDGGKWICDPENLNEKSVVYSIGSYEQIDFELAMFKLTGAEIHVFDFSLKPDQQARMLKRTEFKYHNKGIGPRTEGDLQSLPDIMKTLGHEFIDIFKIDCDGCEFSTFPALFETYPDGLPIGQIQLEVHEYNSGNWNKVRDLIELIDSHGWRIFHYEINWDCDQCIEIAFISERTIATLGPAVADV